MSGVGGEGCESNTARVARVARVAHVAGTVMATRRAPGITLLMLDDKKVRGRADWGAMFAYPSTPTPPPLLPRPHTGAD